MEGSKPIIQPTQLSFGLILAGVWQNEMQPNYQMEGILMKELKLEMLMKQKTRKTPEAGSVSKK